MSSAMYVIFNVCVASEFVWWTNLMKPGSATRNVCTYSNFWNSICFIIQILVPQLKCCFGVMFGGTQA